MSVQGGHKLVNMENRENSGNLKNFLNLKEIFYFCRKTWKTQGKCKICHIIVNENVFQGTFLFRVSLGKVCK